MQDCVFCQIVEEKTTRAIESESEMVVAFKTIEPVADVHFLIIPKDHISSFMELTRDEVLGEMKKMAQELIRKHKIEGGYKLLFNGGRHQAVPHLHWHLLGGRFHDEANILSKT